MTGGSPASQPIRSKRFGDAGLDQLATRMAIASRPPLGVRFGTSPLVVVGDLDDGITAIRDPCIDALAAAVNRRQGRWVGRPRPDAFLAPGHDVGHHDLSAFRAHVGGLRRVYHREGATEPGPESLSAFRKVNHAFAMTASAAAAPCATVAIYGYDLPLVPRLLRRLRPDLRIGIFIDTHFPAINAFSHVPHHTETLIGLLGADLVGLPSRAALSNLMRATECILGGRTELAALDSFVAGCGDAYVGAFPGSVDTRHISGLSGQPAIRQQSIALRERLGGPRHLMLAIDDDDEVRGILPRLHSVWQLLRSGQVTASDFAMLQLIMPAADGVASTIGKEVAGLATRINAEFAHDGRPVIHCQRAAPSLAQRVALYLAADSLTASPLLESGNPWALEYVAARPESGRVMLSARSGTAEALPDAILVDPDQPEQLTKGLARAANGTDDLGTTWQQMRAYVVGYDSHAWARRFLGALRWRERAVSNTETDRRWTAGFNLAPTGTARPIADAQ
jgi:trehalose 6-phosphate synthase